MDAVAMSVDILIPGWYRASLELGNCFREREWFSGVNPSLVKGKVRRVGLLSGSGEFEMDVGGKWSALVATVLNS